MIDIGYGVSQLLCEVRKGRGAEYLWDRQEGGAHVSRMYQKNVVYCKDCVSYV